jgi:hypothetical protein
MQALPNNAKIFPNQPCQTFHHDFFAKKGSSIRSCTLIWKKKHLNQPYLGYSRIDSRSDTILAAQQISGERYIVKTTVELTITYAPMQGLGLRPALSFKRTEVALLVLNRLPPPSMDGLAALPWSEPLHGLHTGSI